jgi:DNA repair exonuclease SbcCD nuclease subunit
MKIIIFSDIHIHPHKKSAERLDHCIQTLDWTFRTALEKKIKNIVFLGDLFHDRQKIDVLTYQKTFEIFEEHLCGNELNLTLLLGNHDLWHYQKLDVSSVNPLRNLPGVRIVNSPSVEVLSDKEEKFFFAMLPYTHNPIEDLKKIDQEWNSKNPKNQKILGGHVSVDGAIWNVRYNTTSDVAIEHDGDMVRVGPEIFDSWDRVFLGHYHAAQKLNEKVEYVGSPLQLSFGEAFQDKHLIIYDTESDEKEYVKNTFSPKHYILNEDEISDHELEGQFVRLEVSDLADKQMSDIRQRLTEGSKVATLEIKQSQKKEDHMIKDAKAILYKEEEMLERYVEQANVEGLDKKFLIKIGSEICQRVES